MKLRTVGLTLVLLFAFAFTFSAAMMVAVAEAAPCPCIFYCPCAESWVYGDYTQTPGVCWSSISNPNCICHCI